MFGMIGEGHHGSEDYVWVTKTHYPLFSDKPVDKMDKIIYISRNPIEVGPSFSPLMISSSHSVVTEKPINEHTEYWQFWAKWCAKEIAKFHADMVKQSEVTPTFFVRYEDLREDPKPYLAKMFAFMLDVDSIEGTVIEARLKEVCGVDVTDNSKYVLKSKVKNYNRNWGLYSD